MANYIGNQPTKGEFRKIDAPTFNGSTTAFNLTGGGIAFHVGSATQLLISINGVMQEPNTAYNVVSGGSQIQFTTAPAAGRFSIKVSTAAAFAISNSIAASSASAASTLSPNIIKADAFCQPTSRGSMNVPPESGMSPMALKACINLTEAFATTTSAAKAMLAPAPAATRPANPERA